MDRSSRVVIRVAVQQRADSYDHSNDNNHNSDNDDNDNDAITS